ncbi:processive 1,2-diacylglycerol beta-glucosyltransferase [Clostridiales Family XIII bacterium PM5-7]
MNIIILTGRFGLGHIKAAEAIKEELLLENEHNNVEIIDFMDYLFPTFSKQIYKGFNFLVSKCSGLYNVMNKTAGNYGKVPLKVTITKKIDNMIDDFEADAIVVAFPICSQYISAYKNMRRCDIPLYTYITDITAHEEWIAAKTDKYFVGDITTKNTLMSKGVAEDKIVVSGIPVRKCFSQGQKKKTTSQKEILIMGGGLGLIPSSRDFLKTLNDQKDVKVTMIAGQNEKLAKDIKENFKRIEVIGYTDEVDRYMKRADLLVTKAGGITTFEAIATKTPLYVIRPFLEQELGNAKYIEEHNIGRVIWSNQTDEAEALINLIHDNELIQLMKSNMDKVSLTFESRVGLCS